MKLCNLMLFFSPVLLSVPYFQILGKEFLTFGVVIDHLLTASKGTVLNEMLSENINVCSQLVLPSLYSAQHLGNHL